MNAFIRTLNLIKTHRDMGWLTSSQLQALTALEKSLRVSGTVNLYGGPGVGKTFLAWSLADKMGYVYFPHLECLKRGNVAQGAAVIIDNGLHSRQFHRDILKILQFKRVSRAVLITRELVHDYTHYVPLFLHPEDLEKVRQNLGLIGCSTHDIGVNDLWHLINPYL